MATSFTKFTSLDRINTAARRTKEGFSKVKGCLDLSSKHPLINAYLGCAASSGNELLFFEPKEGGLLFPRQERDVEMSSFGIIIRPPSPGESYGRPHVFQDFQIIIKTTFGNANLHGTIGWRAGALVIDEMIKADQPMQ
jgi:hypothetical protein